MYSVISVRATAIQMGRQFFNLWSGWKDQAEEKESAFI